MNQPENGKKSTAQLTREYIEARPALRSLLIQDIINYTSLARQMVLELGTGNEDAIVVALRRYVQENGGLAAPPDKAVKELLGKSNIFMKTGIACVTARHDWSVMSKLESVFGAMMASRVLLQINLGTDGLTIITEQEACKDILEKLAKDEVIRVRQDLAEVAVSAPEDIADTPGVVAHLSSVLSQHGINVVEMVSCYTDVIFIVKDRDTVPAYETLRKHVG